MRRQRRASAHETNSRIAAAFLATHDGRSTDDVVIDDERNERFVREAQKRLPGMSASELNRRLLNFRKTGELGPVATKRVRLKNRDRFVHAAEMAARCLEDKHDLTVDRVLCDPAMRTEFDRIAESIVPGYSAYEYRRAALYLHKMRRLPPEPMKRLRALRSRVVLEDAAVFEAEPTRIPKAPGIYAFLDDTGYLYIGETQNLHARLRKHLDHSDVRSLAHYLWEHGSGRLKLELLVFAKGSEGALSRSRKALEAHLIQSRAPRFNVKCR